ncbi:MAG: transporter substrate-binding domain-containing protein [Lactobacillaceae bacterium]|nr:transporter substrate-binding domain-containing protein [Lactobacillaceae bacterium]
MKLNLFIFSIFLGLGISSASADDNIGLRTITQDGRVKCGTDISSKTLAYKDADGFWHGYAVDWCKIFAKAMLDRSDAFEMIDISEEDMESAFSMDKIDIMIGAGPISANKEYKSETIAANTILYDYQSIMVRKIDGAKSLQDYKGERVCAIADSTEASNMKKYIDTYNLDLSVLPLKDKKQAREAFMLKRCNLITGSKAYLISMHQNNLGGKDTFQIIPENVGVKQEYVYVKYANNKLRVLTKWVINSMQLAEENDINSQNIGIIIGINDVSLKNLLGDNEATWKSLGLNNPKWVRDAIGEFGNFGEIYDRNFGTETIFKFERGNNNLHDNGGLIIPHPFL